MDQENEAILLSAYRNVFSHPEAGMVLLDLARICCFFFPSDQGRGAEDTAGNEGRRAVFLTILINSGIHDLLADVVGDRMGIRASYVNKSHIGG